MANIGGLNSSDHISHAQQSSNDQNKNSSSDYQNAPLGDLANKARDGDQTALDRLAALIYALQNTLSHGITPSAPTGNANHLGGNIQTTNRDLHAPQMRMLSASNQFSNGAAINGSTGAGKGFNSIGGINSRQHSMGSNFQGSGSESNFEAGSVFRRSNDIFDQVAELLEEQQRIGMQSAQLTASSGAISSALQALQSVARNIRA
ncbi:hypothetical protein AB833_30450 [Chromatiales bacterium (ex Bugula neritina AB1)]|nr:hypothetical protein AB833_30450 [Chromatiales bacterium (ex Bugula neritina AB1)]